MSRKRPSLIVLNWLASAALMLATTTLSAQSSAPTRALQRLTNDLALQLDLNYRHDLPAHRARYDEMAAALTAWNRSRRTDADYALMEQWLRSAIRNSMPGDNQPLAAPPKFAAPRPAIAKLPTPRQATPAPKSIVVRPQTVIPAPVATQPEKRGQNDLSTPATDHLHASPSINRSDPFYPRPAPRDFWSKHPAARPLDTSNPFRDDPAPQPRPKPESVVAVAPPVQRPAEAVQPPAVRTAMRLPVIEAADVAVNLPELASRIGGYNQALRRIEAAVIAADQPDVGELAKLLAELEQLDNQRDFIDLYVVGLSPQERKATPELGTADAVLSLIEEKIGDRIGSPAATDNSIERDILRALVQKLAELQRKLPDTP